MWISASAAVFSACSTDSGTAAGAAEGQTDAAIEVTVSAASSLKDSLQEIGKQFAMKHPQIKVNYNFGGSGSLQQQIEQGAPVDLFISAARKPMDALVQGGQADASQMKLLLSNQLVLIVPVGAPGLTELQDLNSSDVRVVAVGDPDTVPAGDYAKQALEDQQLWEKVQAKAVYAKDVVQVLSYVQSGNADAGFVYASDVRQAEGIRTALSVDPALHQPIEYPAAILNEARSAAEAGLFLDYLQSNEAAAVFQANGFTLPGDKS